MLDVHSMREIFHRGKLSKVFINQMILVVVFAILYYVGHKIGLHYKFHKDVDSSIRHEPFSFFDAFRFSLVTQTTVGYGAEAPQTIITKVINVMQLLSIYSVVIVSLI